MGPYYFRLYLSAGTILKKKKEKKVSCHSDDPLTPNLHVSQFNKFAAVGNILVYYFEVFYEVYLFLCFRFSGGLAVYVLSISYVQYR